MDAKGRLARRTLALRLGGATMLAALPAAAQPRGRAEPADRDPQDGPGGATSVLDRDGKDPRRTWVNDSGRGLGVRRPPGWTEPTNRDGGGRDPYPGWERVRASDRDPRDPGRRNPQGR